jgi:uncharacterized protein (TIGR00369 family)
MTSIAPPLSEQDLRTSGWEGYDAPGFTGEVGTLWTRREGDRVAVAMVTGQRHQNHLANTVHGGVLMTFADNALGTAVVHSLGAVLCSTVSLQTQFVSPGKIGEVLWCQPEVVRKGRRLVFVRGLICAGERVVATADGIWNILGAKA